MKPSMCITRGVFAGVLLASALPLFGQETLISVSVEPKGALYRVDGVQYSAPSSFTWPTGSKHVLEIMTTCAGPPSDVCQTRYAPAQQPWTVVQGGKLEVPSRS